jgi:penicillin-binding protein 2
MFKTGVAFPEYIVKDRKNQRSRNYNSFESSFRENFLLLCLILVAGAILVRVFYLQVIRGSYYRYLSDSNRIKTIIIHAPRGIVFDRNNTPLTFNMPGFRKVVSGKIELLSKDKALDLISKGEKGLEIDTLRNYPYKEATAHVSGFIGQISPKELENPSFVDYKLGDLLGKEGIEKEFEQKLKGVNGEQLFEVDSVGKEIRKLGQTDPISGENIKLTIDEKLQTTAYEATEDVKKGAVVISNPKGEILAIVSRPSFDPNLFTMGKDYTPASVSASLSDILNDSENQPMLDRAISGVYPPGSTFKLIVAAAGLGDKIIDENYQVEDTGVLKIGAFSFSNWYFTGYGRTDGSLNIVGGIKRSNDIFFYKLAGKIGIDTLSSWAKKFGLGKPLGIDLPGELGGTVPSLEWKQKAIGEQWYLGDTYNFGIGQGYLLTTPLQVNNWTQVIANGGTLYKPQILFGQTSEIRSQKLLNEKNLELIRQGMMEACSPGGVAWPLFNFKVRNDKLKVDGKNILEAPISSGSADMRQVVLACKTGTAEHGDSKTLPHAWITLFAPAYDPQIVITVLVEESGEGSNIAAPIAKKILESYFSK